MSTSHSRAPVASTSLDLLDRSRASLLLACRTGDAGERYVEAHLGALRAAAALLAARSLPGASTGSGRVIRASTTRSRPRSVWELLPRVAPELTEWAAFFAASARRRAAVERGGRITARESDDLLRQAENFLEIVQGLLGLPVDDTLAPISRYVAPVSWSGPGAGPGLGPGVGPGVGPGAGSGPGGSERPGQRVLGETSRGA